jgi:hypothetical protein
MSSSVRQMISENQLVTWSNPGGTDNSQRAHTSVRNALEALDSPIRDRDFEIFLQGSYKNSTNIRADSDVDLVVQLNEVFYKDLSRLPADQQAKQVRDYAVYGPGRHNAQDWRRDVEAALRTKFGNALKQGNGKAFHLVTGPGNMTADVLPAVLFKNYTFFAATNNERFQEGLEFADPAGNYIVNYPKIHIKNGEAKNSQQQARGHYKPAVRMFKNARNRAVERSFLRDGDAPSYFIECLLYNVPNECFTAGMQETYAAVVNHLSGTVIDAYLCQNGLLNLFGSASTQWNTIDARAFIHALARLWNEGV